MKIVNLTPHELRVKGICHRSVYHPDGENWWDETTPIPPSGEVARVEVKEKVVEGIKTLHDEYLSSSIPVVETTMGKVVGLPEPTEGTIFVTSLVVAQAAANMGRKDVLSPGRLIRDEKGRVVGCDGLSRPSANPPAEGRG